MLAQQLDDWGREHWGPDVTSDVTKIKIGEHSASPPPLAHLGPGSHQPVSSLLAPLASRFSLPRLGDALLLSPQALPLQQKPQTP